MNRGRGEKRSTCRCWRWSWRRRSISSFPGRMFETPRFQHVPAGLRRLNDIALSGDGEPTACPQFVEVVELVGPRAAAAAARRRETRADHQCQPAASRPREARLEMLDANGGEIWAKLDAGTEAYYRTIARSAVPWQRILDNLRKRPGGGRSSFRRSFLSLNCQPPTDAEVAAYAERLREIVAAGGQIKLVQIHTIARPPAEAAAAPLANAELDRLAALVRSRTACRSKSFTAPARKRRVGRANRASDVDLARGFRRFASPTSEHGIGWWGFGRRLHRLAIHALPRRPRPTLHSFTAPASKRRHIKGCRERRRRRLTSGGCGL